MIAFRLDANASVATGHMYRCISIAKKCRELGKECLFLLAEDEYTEILGNKLVCYSIPIRPGRNVAIIVESAAINHRQKQMGYNAAQELYKRVQENLSKKRRD